MKRILTIFLAVSLAASGLLYTGCSETPAESSESTAADKSTESENISGEMIEEEEDSLDFRTMLPEADFHGQSYTMLAVAGGPMSAFFGYELTAEDITGEAINDAVYNRNINIEDAYGVKLEEMRLENLYDTVQQSIAGGDNAYQLVIGYWGDMASLSSTGQMLDWNAIDYIDVYKPWYYQSINTGCIINGKIFLEMNYIPFTSTIFTHCMYYNKDAAADLNLESPYDYVFDGTWTVDKMGQYITNLNQDMDGNGVLDVKDFYGLIVSQGGTLVFTYAFDNPTMKISENYECELTLFSEKMSNSIDKVLNLCYANNSTYITDNSKEIDNAMLFRDGHSLMYAGFLSDSLLYFRDMEDEYGLMPYPKYDEQQEKYYTKMGGGSFVLGLPITVSSDIDFVSIITEALSIESYRLVYPAVHEQSLQNKALRDKESQEMFHIITEGAQLDFTQLYRMDYTAYCNILQTCVEAGQNLMSSRSAAIKRSAVKHYQGILDDFAEFTND